MYIHPELEEASKALRDYADMMLADHDSFYEAIGMLADDERFLRGITDNLLSQNKERQEEVRASLPAFLKAVEDHGLETTTKEMPPWISAVDDSAAPYAILLIKTCEGLLRVFEDFITYLMFSGDETALKHFNTDVNPRYTVACLGMIAQTVVLHDEDLEEADVNTDVEELRKEFYKNIDELLEEVEDNYTRVDVPVSDVLH